MQPEKINPTPASGESALLAIALAIQSAFGSGAVKLGIVQKSNDFTSSSSTTVQFTDFTLTINMPAGGRDLELEAYMPAVTAVNITTPILTIWENAVVSGTQLAQSRVPTIPVGNYLSSGICKAIITPSPGVHTYNVGFSNTAGQSTTAAATSTAKQYFVAKIL